VVRKYLREGVVEEVTWRGVVKGAEEIEPEENQSISLCPISSQHAEKESVSAGTAHFLIS